MPKAPSLQELEQELKKQLHAVPMKFKVEVEWHDTIIKHTFFAHHLEELSEKILDEYPNAKVISVIGGG